MNLVLLLCGRNPILQRMFIARHLSDFFGKRLIVPESCIAELGQNHVPPKFESMILDDKKFISGPNL